MRSKYCALGLIIYQVLHVHDDAIHAAALCQYYFQLACLFVQ